MNNNELEPRQEYLTFEEFLAEEGIVATNGPEELQAFEESLDTFYAFDDHDERDAAMARVANLDRVAGMDRAAVHEAIMGRTAAGENDIEAAADTSQIVPLPKNMWSCCRCAAPHAESSPFPCTGVHAPHEPHAQCPECVSIVPNATAWQCCRCSVEHLIMPGDAQCRAGGVGIGQKNGGCGHFSCPGCQGGVLGVKVTEWGTEECAFLVMEGNNPERKEKSCQGCEHCEECLAE
ncbi:hypothetical protein ACHAQA_000155 [Verticillium albo-atrum]